MSIDEINEIIDKELELLPTKNNLELTKGMMRIKYVLNKAAGLKLCPRCKEWLTANNFKNVKTRYDGLSAYCKSCEHDQRMNITKQNEGGIETC